MDDPTQWRMLVELHRAIGRSDSDEVERLIAEGVNINEPDGYGRTALHVACTNDSATIVKLLLAAGANVDVKDMKGCRPFELTQLKEVRDLLFGQGATYSSCPQGNLKPSTKDQSRGPILSKIEERARQQEARVWWGGEPEREETQAEYRARKRTCYAIVEPRGRASNLSGSKRGGIPLFDTTWEWPCCNPNAGVSNSCGEPMRLEYQIELDEVAELPIIAPAGADLMLCFMCVRDYCLDGEMSAHIQFVRKSEISVPITKAPGPTRPEKFLRLNRLNDYPSPVEAAPPMVLRPWVRFTHQRRPKIGGYPTYIQDTELCKQCRKPMACLIQFRVRHVGKHTKYMTDLMLGMQCPQCGTVRFTYQSD